MTTCRKPAPSQRHRARRDRGSITVEVVIVTPVAILLLCLVAFVGRTASAREQVNESARDAARAASFERDPLAAEAAAHDAAASSLTASDTRCARTDVQVDVTSFGPDGQVAVSVTCEIPLSDLGLLGITGTREVTARSVSVLDTYRGPA